MTTLEVCVVSIPVLVISVGEAGILLAVWDSSKWRMVIKARVEDLIYYFLCLLSADVPHGQDGAQGPASDTCLTQGKTQIRKTQT